MSINAATEAVATITIGEGEPLPPSGDRSGGGSVIGDMFRAERPKLLRFLARWTGREGAEDVVQQAFLRVAAKGEDYAAAIEAPHAYLRKVTLNLMRNEARHDARTERAGHIPIDDVVIPGPDPMAALEARDQLARIEAAMRKLKPFTRDIFVAHRVDGYSYQEIAERTGLSVRGVEKQMRTAIQKLGRHLRQHG